jgi:hypothetical protein
MNSLSLTKIKIHFRLNHDVSDDWITTVVNTNSYEGNSDYISMVYSIAIEKLSGNKSDLRKLTIEEDGNSIKVELSIKISSR